MRWFKHQTASHTDARLKRLILRQGMAGYGLYWYCLELIGKDVSESNLTFEIEEDSELLAHATGMPREQVEAALRTMIDLGLFESCEGRVTCLKMLQYIDSSMFKAGKIREVFQQEKDRLLGESTCTGHVPSTDLTCTFAAGQDRTGQDRTERHTSTPGGVDALPPPKTDPIPYAKIQELWNTICVPAGLAAAQKLTNKRKAAMRQRHKSDLIGQSLDNWREYFECITRSPFLTGRVGKPWRANLDFALREDAMVKTLEGEYHR
jgi:hypothetical protein